MGLVPPQYWVTNGAPQISKLLRGPCLRCTIESRTKTTLKFFIFYVLRLTFVSLYD